MAAVLLIFFVASRRVSPQKPRGFQNFLEFVFEFVNGFISDQIHDEKKRARIYALLVALFLFVFVSNVQGLFPLFHSPTNDPNTTLGLALVVFLLIHFYGFNYRGFVGHLSSFFKPVWWLFPILILEIFVTPLVLALRLFGNIYAGDVLVGLAASLAPASLSGLGPVVVFVSSVLTQMVALGFNTFVDLIQSFIFMVLTLVYLSGSMGPAGEH